MPKRKKRSEVESNSTPMALALAAMAGASVIYIGEILYSSLREMGAQVFVRLPSWRAHMGSACGGVLAFVVSFFLLESLGRQSREMAWRTSTPWLPLIALTALATAIHIPIFVVVVAALIYCVYAYRRTVAMR